MQFFLKISVFRPKNEDFPLFLDQNSGIDRHHVLFVGE